MCVCVGLVLKFRRPGMPEIPTRRNSRENRGKVHAVVVPWSSHLNPLACVGRFEGKCMCGPEHRGIPLDYSQGERKIRSI